MHCAHPTLRRGRGRGACGEGGTPDVAKSRMRLNGRNPLQEDARYRQKPATTELGCLPHAFSEKRRRPPTVFPDERGVFSRCLFNWTN